MPANVEPVKLSAESVRLIVVDSGVKPVFLMLSSRELSDSRFNNGTCPESAEGIGAGESSFGGVGSLGIRLKGRRGMGRNNGGPLSP